VAGHVSRHFGDSDAIEGEVPVAPEETPALVNWVRDLVAESYPAMSEDQIVATTDCVNVRFGGRG
jgi:hypothetical protein